MTELILPSSGFFFSAFTYPTLPVIVGENQVLRATEMQWGLIPAWCKDEQQALELRKLSLNAKGETMAEKPMFRKAFQQGRCLIPASGFFEWREVNRKKYPYFIHAKTEPALLFAGISEGWVNRNTGEEIHTYSIVTSPANALLSIIHNTKLRMPLILDYNDVNQWIFGNENEAKALVKPCREEMLEAHTVGAAVSKASADRNVEEIQSPFYYAELEKNTLF